MFKRKKKKQELEEEKAIEIEEIDEKLANEEVEENILDKKLEETTSNDTNIDIQLEKENKEENIDEQLDNKEDKEIGSCEDLKEEQPIEENELPKEEQIISTKNYDDAVVKLIDEVKIFSDDEDLVFSSKRKVWPIIFIIILLLGIAAGIYWYVELREDNPTIKEENVQEEQNTTYRYEKTEKGIEFFANNELLNVYECETCDVYTLGTYEYFSTDPTVLAIKEEENVFLYDYTLNKVVSDNYTKLQNLMEDDKTVAFVATNDTGLSGIIDVRGTVLVPIEYEELGYSVSGGEVSDYSYSKDKITAKKNELWGVINFKGDVLVDFKYEDIYYNGYDAIVVCDEGYWYLTDFEGNRLIDTGYDIMIPIKSYVFASVNHVFYVLNYKGESIISKEIPTYLDTFRSRENAVTATFKIEEDGTVVNIYIVNTNKTYNQYKFNTVNGELTEIIQ